MATNQSNGQDAGGNAGKSVADISPDYVFDGTSAAIVVPVGDALLNSEYSRNGPDLFLETPDGQLILVTNYFAQEIPPDLFTLAGSRITADIAAKLAGPRAPGQVAQNGDISTLEEPIGTVDTSKGVITVIRADGTQVTLAEGDPLYQGDTLVSGADSAIGIIFADKSTMSMAANARIILDELVYDPQDTASNSQVFNVIQGAFMFTSGAIGKSDPEDVSVNTPVATIGIRGTKFGVNVNALDGSTNVTIFEGAVFVQNGAGSVLLTGIGETTLIPSYSLPPSDPERLSLEEIQRLYGDAIGFHPVRQEIPDDHASVDDDDLQDIADDLDDIDTAAGGNQQGGEGANDEFGKIGEQGVGESGLGGTPLGAGGEGDGEGGPFTSGGGSGTGTGEEGEGEGGDPFGGPTVVDLEIGEGVLGDDDIIRFSSAPLSSGTNYTVSAPPGSGTQQLGLDASGLGGGNSGLTLQSGSTPDSVNPGKQSAVLSSSDGMNLTINGFEELAITLGGGADTIDIGNLTNTSIIPDTITIFAGDGDDTIRTTDTTTGTKLVVDAGDGDDFVTGSELNDQISGGAGNDTIQGGAGDDSVSGGTGNDVLVGATGDDILEGNEGDDQLLGFGGDDTLLGGSGDDLLEGGTGSDIVDGGEGDDRAIFIVGQDQTEGVNDAYDGGANTETGGDTIVINFDTDALENPVFRQAILDIYAMLGNAASGSPEEFDIAPFQALGVDIQNFEAVELDGPSFALLPEDALAVEEDGSILLNLAVTEVLPNKSVSVTIGNLNGASLVDNEGTPVGTDNGDGTFTLTAEQLDGLTVKPAANSDVDLNLSVTVTTVDEFGNEESVGDNLDVSVIADADAPILEAANVAGSEDTDIPLSLSAALSDQDGSEVLTGITITGLPEGATLSAGTVQPDGSVRLTAADLQGLTMKPPANFSGEIQLAISATAVDGTTDSQEASAEFTVTVSGVADTPTLELNDTAGSLAAQIPVDISSTLTDLDGSEELTVTISGLNGATLSAGSVNDDGTVTLTADELDGLTVTPGPNTVGSIELTVTATATEDDGDTASVSGTVTISVAHSSTVVLVPGQDLDLVAAETDNPNDTQKLVLDAGFGGATTGDDWIIAQDDLGRVTLTNTLTGQLVTADGYEEIDIDFGPGEDTVELRDLSNTDLTNDTLTLNMGDGDDTVVAGEDVNRDVEIHGGAGNDDLQGSNGADLIDGGADDDVLSGGAGDDDLDGGEGSDTYLWSEGDGVDAYGDTGTEGIDTIVAQAASFDGIADGFNAGQAGIEAIGRDSDGDGEVDTGSPLLIALSDSSETVDFSGLDFLNSQTTIDLGGGNDTVTTAVGDGDAVTYMGGEGQDTLNLLLTAESLNQMISAGQLALLQSYIASPDNAVLTLTTPNIVAQGFETVRIGVLGNDGSVADVTAALSNASSDDEGFGEVILGTNQADLIFAGGGNDIVRSFGGDDALFGGAGEDYLNAGADEDYVDGGTGNDIIDGGSGNDRLLGGDGADLVSGGQGEDYISGGEGNDILAGFQGDDIIEGDAGDVNLSGGSGQDSLYGGEGNDRLVGGSGDDFLIGGDGIDILDGQTGDDMLIADDYEDQLFGGTGNDTLVSTMDELPESRVSSGAQGNFSGVRDGGEGEDTFRLQQDSDDLGPHALSGDEFSNIRNIETLDLSGVDQLQLSLRVEDVVTMTDEDNDLTILLGENVTSVEIDDETIQLEDGQAIFEQDGVHIVLQQQQPPPEAS